MVFINNTTWVVIKTRTWHSMKYWVVNGNPYSGSLQFPIYLGSEKSPIKPNQPGLWSLLTWAVFFLVVWALYTIRQRHAYAKLTRAYAEWKVAYAEVFCLELLTRVVTQGLFCQHIWRSQLWCNFGYCPATWPFVASFPFILAFCGFISFHFGLLWLHCAFHKSVWFVLHTSENVGDLWLGLSVAYAGLTWRLRSAYAGGAGSFWQT